MLLDTRYSSILKVALPLMLSGFIQSVLSMTDAAFLSRYSTLAFDASGSAGLWYITMHMAFIGMADGAQILMANAIGEKNPNKFAKIFQTSLFNLSVIAILLTLIVHLVVPQLMHSLVTNKELAAAELSFLKIRGYAFWASIITLTLQATYFAAGKTTVVLISAAVVAVTNVILAYLFVFGFGSVKAMGLEGAAIASTLAEILGMLFLIIVFLKGNFHKTYPFWSKIWVEFSSIREHVKVGFPLLLQGIVALSVWTFFFIWIEQMGHHELTSSLNIRYIYFVAFVPIWGFAAATKTYIAQFIGAKQYDQLPIIQRRIQLLTAAFLILTFHGAVFYPELLIKMVNSNEEYLATSSRILRIVSGSILIYGLTSVYFQTVSGSGNTRVTFLIECICTTLYLSSAYLLIKVWKAPIEQVWLVEYVYFIAMGVASLIYLRFFNWTKQEKI